MSTADNVQELIEWLRSIETTFITRQIMKDFSSGVTNVHEQVVTEIEQLFNHSAQQPLTGNLSNESLEYVHKILDSISDQQKATCIQSLTREKICMEQFVVLVGLIIDMRMTSELIERNITPVTQLQLARLYLRMLQWKGSRTVLFNSFIFRSIFLLLKNSLTDKLHNTMYDEDELMSSQQQNNNDEDRCDEEYRVAETRSKKRKRSNKAASQPTNKKQKVTKKSTKKKTTDTTSFYSDLQLEVIKLIPELCDEVIQVLSNFSLEEHSDLVYYIIEKMTLLTRSKLITIDDAVTKTNKRKKSTDSAQQTEQLYSKLFQILQIASEDESNFKQLLQNMIANLVIDDVKLKRRCGKFIQSMMNSENMSQMYIFIQHLCVRVSSEKADVRVTTLLHVSEIYFRLTTGLQTKFLHFLTTLSKNKLTNQRIVAVELVAILFEEHVKQINFEDEENDGFEPVQTLFFVIIARSIDKIASIRHKSLSSFASIIANCLKDRKLTDTLKQLLTPEDATEIQDEEEQQTANRSSTSASPSASNKSTSKASEESCGFIGARTTDVSAIVRKSAIQVIENLIMLNPRHYLKPAFVDVIKRHSIDSTVSNRKQAIVSIANLATQFPSNNYIVSSSVVILLVSAFDGESSVSEKALELCHLHIFERIEQSDGSIWSTLEGLNTEYIRLLRKVCTLLYGKKLITSSLVKRVAKCLKNQRDLKSAWNLMDELSQHFPKNVPIDFIHQSIQYVKDGSTGISESDAQIFEQCLSVLSKTCDRIAASYSTSLSDLIIEQLSRFSIATNLIHSYIVTLARLLSDKEEATKIFNQLINNCYTELHKYVMMKDEIPATDAQITNYLFTIGELVMSFVKQRIPNKVVTIVQALVASSLTNFEYSDVQQQTHNNNERRKRRLREVQISSIVRSHAFTTLGKLCIMDEALAKKSVPLFLSEIDRAKDESVRNNILIIMCDLCVRYTSVVDRYVSKISESMCDKNSSLVRRNATVLLTQILAEDFIKWKPLLLFRFLVVLNDSCDLVAKSAEYALLNILPRKNSNLIFNHVIESIFVLNHCTNHPYNNSYIQSEREVALFTFGGEDTEQVRKRYTIYKFMLTQLTTDQKMQIAAKLHTEVLAMFAEETIPIHKNVLLDVITILSWPEFKFTKARTTNSTATNIQVTDNLDDDNELLDNDEMNQMISDMKGKLLGSVLKKHVTENVVPIIIELKRTLEKRRSPLLKQLMLYLQIVLHDYKSEMKEMLSQDSQLAKEIEFDMRRMELPAISATPNRKVPFFSPSRRRSSNVR